MTTLVDLLERAATASAVGLRFVDRLENTQWCPWDQLVTQATRVAAGLCTRGVESGARVGVIARSEPWFPVGFFGAVLAGAVPVPIAPPQRLGAFEEQLEHLRAGLAAVDAELVVCEPRRGRRLANLLRDRSLEVVAVEDLELQPPPGRAGSHAEPETTAVIQFSSGSTAKPKAIELSHRAVVTQAQMLNVMWPIEPGVEAPTGVSWLPMFHDMGLVGALLTALERPGTVQLIEPEVFLARPAVWLRTISRYRAQISAAPSFGYAHAAKVIRDHELDGVDLSCWRFALNGAEPIDVEGTQAFAERFARWGFDAGAMTPVYGLAEATLGVSFAPPGRGLATCAAAAAPDRSVVCLGAPMPGVEVQVRDDAGRVLGTGPTGEVWVRSPALMSRYHGDVEATERVLVDGWLATGDLGFLDHGEVHLVGRAKDVVIVNGRNLSPEPVETHVARTCGLDRQKLAVVGAVLGGGGREQLVVLVEDDAGAVEPAMVTAAVVAASGVRPDLVLTLEPGSLPRTTSGKVRRQEARQRLVEGAWVTEAIR